MRQMTMAISGMTCGGCVSGVRNALRAVPGTRVDAGAVGSATVSYDAARTTPALIAQAVRDAGYESVTGGALIAAGVTGAAGGCCGGGSGEGGSCCA